jgi:hypothetical protein
MKKHRLQILRTGRTQLPLAGDAFIWKGSNSRGRKKLTAIGGHKKVDTTAFSNRGRREGPRTNRLIRYGQTGLGQEASQFIHNNDVQAFKNLH